MPEQIIDGAGSANPLKIASGGYALVGGYSGTNPFPLAFDSSGNLRTSATVTAGSEQYIYGKSGADWYPVAVASGTGKLDVDVTMGGAYVPSGNVYIQSGVNWAGVGSVFNAGGSVNITSPQLVGSLATQGIAGSVAITTSPVPISGTITQSYPNVETIRLTTTGSPNVDDFDFSANVKSVSIDNLGGGNVYFAINGTPDVGSTTGYLPDGETRAFDVSCSGVSFLPSGTDTPAIQVFGLR